MKGTSMHRRHPHPRLLALDQWRDATGIPPHTKLVGLLLLLMARRLRGVYAAWPSGDAIAARTGLSRATVTRAIADLVERRLVSRQRWEGKTTTVSVLHIEQFIRSPGQLTGVKKVVVFGRGR